VALYVDVSDAFGRQLGHVVVHNDSSGDSKVGNYNLKHADGEIFGRVEGHWRANGWEILCAAALAELSKLRDKV
jgi:hypothetical protein